MLSVTKQMIQPVPAKPSASIRSAMPDQGVHNNRRCCMIR